MCKLWIDNKDYMIISYDLSFDFFLFAQNFGFCVCVCVCIYIYIYIYIHTHRHTYKVHSKSSKPHLHLDLWYIPNLSMCLTCYEIETEICISFFSFMKNGSELAQQNCLAMTFISGWGFELFKQLLILFLAWDTGLKLVIAPAISTWSLILILSKLNVT